MLRNISGLLGMRVHSTGKSVLANEKTITTPDHFFSTVTVVIVGSMFDARHQTGDQDLKNARMRVIAAAAAMIR